MYVAHPQAPLLREGLPAKIEHKQLALQRWLVTVRAVNGPSFFSLGDSWKSIFDSRIPNTNPHQRSNRPSMCKSRPQGHQSRMVLREGRTDRQKATGSFSFRGCGSGKAEGQQILYIQDSTFLHKTRWDSLVPSLPLNTCAYSHRRLCERLCRKRHTRVRSIGCDDKRRLAN